MQARLISNNSGISILYSNGLSCVANKQNLMQFLFRFKQIKHLDVVSDSDHSQNKLKPWNQEYLDIALVPGNTLAYISDDFNLIIIDIAPFEVLIDEVMNSFNLLTSEEYAQLHNKSVEQVKTFCRAGRIPGAKKVGRDWVLPGNVPYPLDRRRK